MWRGKDSPLGDRECLLLVCAAEAVSERDRKRTHHTRPYFTLDTDRAMVYRRRTVTILRDGLPARFPPRIRPTENEVVLRSGCTPGE